MSGSSFYLEPGQTDYKTATKRQTDKETNKQGEALAHRSLTPNVTYTSLIFKDDI